MWIDIRSIFFQNKNSSKGVLKYVENCSDRAWAIWMILIIKENLPFDPVVYEQKEEFMTELRELHDRIDDKMPVANKLLDVLIDFNEVAKQLQLRETTLAEGRGFFDNLHAKYGTETFIPDLAIRTKFFDHLKVVQSADFENAIINGASLVQIGAKGTLTGDEA